MVGELPIFLGKITVPFYRGADLLKVLGRAGSKYFLVWNEARNIGLFRFMTKPIGIKPQY